VSSTINHLTKIQNNSKSNWYFKYLGIKKLVKKAN